MPAAAIDEIAEASCFPSRKAVAGATADGNLPPALPWAPAATLRQPRRRTTGRDRQINIKATEDTIAELYRVADELDLPLGALLERALKAWATKRD